MKHGRREPYTEIGVRRLPCVRCGTKARFQWSVCADGNLFRPLCTACDISLNELVLKWMNDPNWATKITTYREQKERTA